MFAGGTDFSVKALTPARWNVVVEETNISVKHAFSLRVVTVSQAGLKLGTSTVSMPFTTVTGGANPALAKSCKRLDRATALSLRDTYSVVRSESDG
jgi:hypothetical protein